MKNTIIALLIALAAPAYSAEIVRYWPGDVQIEYNPSGALGRAEVIDRMVEGIEYAAWSWGQRLGKQISYIGETEGKGGARSGKVTIIWVDSGEMLGLTGNPTSYGTADTWYYVTDGSHSGVILHLNSWVFTQLSDQCAQNTIIHEMGHALGIRGHAEHKHDVMYWYQEHCRYALSEYDADMVPDIGTDKDLCFVELTREGDLYIPNFGGMAAYLAFDGTDRWSLEQYEPVIGGGCNTVAFDDETGMVTMTDVRTKGASYSLVELVPVADNTWQLHYAH
jgi:hypothetical protein